jgi:hypothetical protein
LERVASVRLDYVYLNDSPKKLVIAMLSNAAVE